MTSRQRVPVHSGQADVAEHDVNRLQCHHLLGRLG
jgi:hypothetical protein